MLHILFLILKIIGIILLAILGILILLLLVVLFVPLRYRVECESEGDIKAAKAEVKFSWLLHLLSGVITYKDEKLKWNIRCLWKKLSDETTAQDIQEEKKTSEKPEKKAEKKVEKKVEKKAAQKESSKPEKTQEVTEERETEAENKFQKLKYTIQTICDKIKIVVEFLKEEAHKNTLSVLKKELIRLVLFLKPKKMNGKIRFGMDDPYTTGQILAVLSVLYPFYAESVEIYPEFEQKVLEGNISIRGKIRGIYAAIVVFNIIISKDVRTTIKDIKALL